MNERAATVLLAMVMAACASAPRGPQFAKADYPGVLRAPASLPFDVVWQQRVTASWGEGRQRGFDAAIQKQGERLTVLGLSPMGSLGFSVVMHGDAIEVQNNTGEDLPFPPRFILLDVQRAFFPWLPVGQTTAIVDGERITERREGGRLLERRFHRGDKPGDIVVRYEWAQRDWQGPSRVVIANGWFGYQLTVDTHSETLLASEHGSDSAK